MGIVRLEKPPKSPKDLKKMLKEFEGYWQIKLQTLEPYGMNLFDEFYNPEYHDKAGRSYLSPCIMCVQYIGGCSVHRGDIMSTSGRYHEYIRGCSVHWGIS